MADARVARLLRDQIDYYALRANEYDEWFFRVGRYDHGADANARWRREVEEVAAALEAARPGGRILDLACGTGLWTERLARYGEVTALDASSEMLAVNRARVGDAVTHVRGDAFDPPGESDYDLAFFGFWLSHVPPERFEGFWERLRGLLAPGGRVFFVDSLYQASSAAVDDSLETPGSIEMSRRLNDGREFRIVKVYYEPGELAGRLARLGWEVEVRGTQTHFLYGWGRPGPSPSIETHDRGRP